MSAVYRSRLEQCPCRHLHDDYAPESTLSIGTITVQRDVAVGTVLFSRNALITSAYLTGCTSPVMLGFSMRYLNATQSAFGNHVYDTNVSGIGIRFSSGGYFENPTNTFSYTAQASYVEWWGGKIELIVTGPVASGSLTPGVLGVVMLQGSDGIYRDALTTTLLGERLTCWPAASPPRS